jgi:hypothetical protein
MGMRHCHGCSPEQRLRRGDAADKKLHQPSRVVPGPDCIVASHSLASKLLGGTSQTHSWGVESMRASADSEADRILSPKAVHTAQSAALEY